MKNSLGLLAIAALLFASSGCGCCRGLFGKTSGPLASSLCSPCGPSYAASSCGQTCGPMCNAGMPCSSGGTCGCETGTPVTYGFDGGQLPVADGTSYESTPMTFPTGSGTFGQ